MNKKEVKAILMSMRNQTNEALVNHLLGEIDLREDSDIEQIVANLGNTEEAVREFLKKLEEKHLNLNDEKYPINDMFTYGLSGNCIHLHMPSDLHKSLAENGVSKTIAFVNLQLLDALERIKQLRDDGFYRFKDRDSIYMISPIMIKSEMKFLEGLDFTTCSYSKSDLSDEEFIAQNPEARLAVSIFGKDKNVGTASITFDTMSTKQWQEKKKKATEDLQHKVGSIKDKTK